MQLAAFAFDYDGTLAHDGRVADATVEALRRLKAAGLRLLLLTGRELPHLQEVFPRYDLFDAIVAENGGLLSRPALHEERLLGAPPPAELLAALYRRRVEPISVGRSIIATWEPNDAAALEAIRESGVEWQIVFNKGAVMCLPPGVNKASGLRAALDALELSPLNVCGVGDAENDHAMLAACGYRAAVANAIPALRAEADFVTQARNGAGVVELIERFLAQPAGLTGSVRRHDVLLGCDARGERVFLPPGSLVYVSGASGSGKSRLTTLLIERMLAHGLQLCVVDPEGEYERLPELVALGDAQSAPSLEEATRLLQRPQHSVALNLLGIALEERPRYLARVMKLAEDLRVRSGRPHWLVIDEAHHAMPREAHPLLESAARGLPGTLLVSASPRAVDPEVLAAVQIVITVGEQASAILAEYCQAAQLAAPPAVPRTRRDEAICWNRTRSEVQVIALDTPRTEHQRHIRKYAQGTLGADKSFHFRGPHQALNLRAQNLSVFLQLAAGVDDETWLFHLQRGDYARWFREAINDAELADDAGGIERELGTDAAASRAAIRELVNRRYTAPAGAQSP
ncbi:MAG: HAD hydrolase family protein [Gammaproteobacteria bacterium]|nr:HAD hydrolase family protein [Gammaproteobacteria bacterium]MBV8403869.1 HAD hydrolase family protein [Gammaproteobacteria bacterium]